MREFKPSEADIGLRADVYLAKQYPQYSRSSLERLFDGRVTIGDQPIKPSHRLQTGAKFTVDDEQLAKKPPTIKLPVIYEDDDVLVINKPAGILTHSKDALNSEATVASFIEPGLNQDLTGNRAGIAHRLDRQTSGVIITAKNTVAQAWLQKQFSNRRTKKAYLAVVEGLLEPKAAVIDAPLGRSPKKPQTFRVHATGKPSQTEYKVLKTLQKPDSQYSLVELKPLTGRTHQLRVHLAYLDHPIVGDYVYGQGGPHMLLHAKSLELTLPNRERKRFEAPPPGYFNEFIRV
jgi:23S rRNA pseudouridine1911/1915/1917 synthase